MSDSPHSEIKPLRVSTLDVAQYPPGRQTRLLVELVHDGVGHAIRVPVVVFRGVRSDGPVFGITAAVHGNELNGISVLHRLLREVDPRRLRGTLVAVVVVNIPGLLMHQREFNNSADLNHVMPGRPDGNSAEVFSHRLLDRIVRRFDYLVDLHTASFGRVNSLYVRANMSDQVAAEMAYLQRPQIILHDPPSDYTLRGAAAEMGIPAITLEIRDPQRFQTESIRKSIVGLRAVLGWVGMLPKRKVGLGPPPILCGRSYWTYTDHGGLLQVFPEVTEMLQGGQPIARLTDVFGDTIREYESPAAGVVIGKSVNPVGQTGARILHLGIIADKQSPLFHRREAPAEPLLHLNDGTGGM